jgi:hypothetical protein
VTKHLSAAATFVENKGQWDARVRFQLKNGGKTLWLTDTGIVFDNLRAKGEQTKMDQHAVPQGHRITPSTPNLAADRTYDRLVFCEDFIGANGTPAVVPVDVQPGEYNYMGGSDPKGWHTGVRGYAGVIYNNVWPGIDVKLTRNGADIEQEFKVHPGADLNRVQIAYRGIDGLTTAGDGSLEINTVFGKLRETPPTIYQEIGGHRVPIEGRFKLLGKTGYSFEVAAHKAEYAIIVDPTLLYSTFLGGSAGNSPYSHNNEVATAIAVDTSGNAYVTGYTASTDFPTTPGAFQTTTRPGQSSFVTKLNPTGSSLIYSTYFSGTSGSGPFPSSIALDRNGYAYVAGYGASSGFPTSSNAYSQSCSGSGFLSVLNSTGSGLVYSTCFASSIYVTSMAANVSGRAFLAGYTFGVPIPTTPNAYQTSYPGARGSSAFAAVFDTNASGAASLIYSTYFGIPSDYQGAYGTAAYAVATDPYDNMYLAGYAGDNLPVTPGAFQSTIASGIQCNPYGGAEWTCPDAFIAKLNPYASGVQSLIYSTYLGGPGSDSASAIVADGSGNAYVTGYTNSTAFPVTPGAFQTRNSGNFATFVSKLNAGGSALIYSTYLDGTAYASSGNGIAVDFLGDAYVTGQTNSATFPVTPDAFQSSCTKLGGSTDFSCAFLTKFNPTGSAPIYSSYLGGSQDDVATSVAIDQTGDAYISGHTSSPDLPVTPGVFQPVMDGTGDAFITKFPLGGTFRVLQILPSSGGNSGNFTATISGSGFEAGVSVVLKGPGGSIVANPVNVGPNALYLTATFNLQGVSVGTYDVIVTNANGAALTLPAAFTIQEGGVSNVQVTKIGTKVVPGRNATYTILLSNIGTVDSGSLHLNEYLEPWFTYTAANPVPTRIVQFDAGWPVALVGTGAQYNAVLQWEVANVPPSGVQSFTYTVSLDPAFPPGDVVNGCAGWCIDQNKATACLNDLGKCMAKAEGLCLLDPGGYLPCLALATIGCELDWGGCIGGAFICWPETVVASLDPNDLVGSPGAGVQRWVSGLPPLQYSISFANDPKAQVPAQKVVVTTVLDPSLNTSSLKLSSINIPNAQVILPPNFAPASGQNEVNTTVDLRPGQNLLVTIDVTLDPNSRTLTWTFSSIDPTTGQPPVDPNVGFLPPGTDGNVSFIVVPQPGLPTGIPITEQATIVFDSNPAMTTQPWINTIDNSPPVSQVSPLPPTENGASFKVQWSGTDQGSGIKDYTVYASDNGGPFTAFLVNTTATSTSFTGQAGHTYGFYSIARDLVGNVENPKIAAEATTQATQGGAPSLKISPTSLTFGSVVVGTTSAAKTMKLTHKGPTLPMLTFSSITASGDFTQTNDCPGTLDPGKSCTITVIFTPNVAGAVNGALSVYDSFGNSPQVVQLTGTGVASVSAAPASLSFSSPVGSTSNPGTVTVTNSTAADVTLSYSASTTFNAAPGSPNGCGSTVPANGNCEIAVTFTPEQPGTIYGSLVVSGAFPTQVVDLTGAATGGSGSTLTFSPAKLIFKTPQAIGTTSAPLTVTMTNKGTSAVTVSGLSTSTGFAATPSGTKPCNGSLAPKAKCTFQVTFTPPVTGPTNGSISVANSGPINPVLYDVSGTGVNVVSFSPASLTFAAQAVGTTSAPQTVTLFNNQSVSLNVASIVASGDYSAVPGGTNPCGSAVVADSSCTFVVTFSPTKAGAIKGVVTITDDATTSPQIFAMTGKGQ